MTKTMFLQGYITVCQVTGSWNYSTIFCHDIVSACNLNV